MRKVIALCTVLALQACASHDFGNFAPQADESTRKAILNDALTQLVSLLPPAKTRLVVHQKATDIFGQSLLTALRKQGYAVEENSEPSTPIARTSIPLAYIIDSPNGSTTYRLTLRVGRQTLTRAYAARPEGVYPAGAWARQE